MAKKTRTIMLAFYKTEEGLHKINTIKNGLENDTIRSFPQIFATIAKSNLQTLLGNEFYAFDKKITDAGRFTYNDTELMASFFHTTYDIMHRFIRHNMANSKKSVKRKIVK